MIKSAAFDAGVANGLSKNASISSTLSEEEARQLKKNLKRALVAAGVIGVGGPVASTALGYHMGKKQKDRGEKYKFRTPQILSLGVPYGPTYQVGRSIAHSA